MWHGYFLIEDLGLTSAQRDTLVNFLKTLGDNNASQPAHRNHRRVRLDNKATIFEARFKENNLTIQKFKNKLAEIFSVDASSITYSTSNSFVTFSRNGDRLLMKLFGGTSATWEESRLECLAYLSNNLDQWKETF